MRLDVRPPTGTYGEHPNRQLDSVHGRLSRLTLAQQCRDAARNTAALRVGDATLLPSEAEMMSRRTVWMLKSGSIRDSRKFRGTDASRSGAQRHVVKSQTSSR